MKAFCLMFCFVALSQSIGFHWSDWRKWIVNENSTRTDEVIIRNGYPLERHLVRTEDGYFLQMFRIPPHPGKYSKRKIKKYRGVFYLQHGLLGSSMNFVADLPRRSLALTLADQGFDVWLGNTRGNSYSIRHMFHSIDSEKFWDFTHDDMAKYDITAMIDHVLKNTSQSQLYYVGHSQGTLVAFAKLSEDFEFQKKIKVLFALAPVTRLRHVMDSIKILGRVCLEIKDRIDSLHITNPIFFILLFHDLKEAICQFTKLPKLCTLTKTIVRDLFTKDLKLTRRDHPSADGTSMKNLWHYAQLVDTGEFQKYDYGYVANLFKYRRIWPPIYNLRNIKTPIVMFSGGKDVLATKGDVAWLNTQLPNVHKNIYLPDFGHISFTWSRTALRDVYLPIAEIANDFP